MFPDPEYMFVLTIIVLRRSDKTGPADPESRLVIDPQGHPDARHEYELLRFPDSRMIVTGKLPVSIIDRGGQSERSDGGRKYRRSRHHFRNRLRQVYSYGSFVVRVRPRRIQFVAQP